MRRGSLYATSWGAVVLLALICPITAWAQEQPAPQTQEIVVAPHWSPYQAPTRYPEGTKLHIIVRGDTLWDLASRYLTNPFLWPQLWNANRYISNPHLIYPGDPLVIPEVEVVRGAEEAAVPGELAPGERPPGVPGGPEAGVPGVTGPVGPSLYPAYEEVSIQCAGYVRDKEDEDVRIIGSEEGGYKIGLSQGDVVYINKGASDGVSPGNKYYVQRRIRKISHPTRWGSPGWLIQRTGWVTILAAQQGSAIAEVTQACLDIQVGDYLLPFEPIPVPLVPTQVPVDRLTPETGNVRGHVVASLDEIVTLGQGHLVSIDVGEEDGVIPGNIFTIFRYLYSDVQRKVLGEMVVLTVQEKTATARISESYDLVEIGDQIELK